MKTTIVLLHKYHRLLLASIFLAFLSWMPIQFAHAETSGSGYASAASIQTQLDVARDLVTQLQASFNSQTRTGGYAPTASTATDRASASGTASGSGYASYSGRNTSATTNSSARSGTASGSGYTRSSASSDATRTNYAPARSGYASYSGRNPSTANDSASASGKASGSGYAGTTASGTWSSNLNVANIQSRIEGLISQLKDLQNQVKSSSADDKTKTDLETPDTTSQSCVTPYLDKSVDDGVYASGFSKYFWSGTEPKTVVSPAWVCTDGEWKHAGFCNLSDVTCSM